jgi:uncharacterized membrane protein
MTDLPPVAPAAAPRLSRRIRWLLIGSLALNLLVVGAVAGVALRLAGGDRMPPPAERSLGFGPWSGGLERSDYRALRKGFEASGQDLRDMRRAERADRAALVAALRADPFDPKALDDVAARMQARTLARLDLGQQLIRGHVLAMTPDQRRAFADRLDRHGRRHHDSDKTGD